MASIRVIIFKDCDQWVAQCLEYDIAAQAADLDTLRSRLLVTINAERMAGIEFAGKPFGNIGPAPRHFQEMWDRKASSFRNTSSVDGDHPVTVELALAE